MHFVPRFSPALPFRSLLVGGLFLGSVPGCQQAPHQQMPPRHPMTHEVIRPLGSAAAENLANPFVDPSTNGSTLPDPPVPAPSEAPERPENGPLAQKDPLTQKPSGVETSLSISGENDLGAGLVIEPPEQNISPATQLPVANTNQPGAALAKPSVQPTAPVLTQASKLKWDAESLLGQELNAIPEVKPPQDGIAVGARSDWSPLNPPQDLQPLPPLASVITEHLRLSWGGGLPEGLPLESKLDPDNSNAISRGLVLRFGDEHQQGELLRKPAPVPEENNIRSGGALALTTPLKKPELLPLFTSNGVPEETTLGKPLPRPEDLKLVKVLEAEGISAGLAFDDRGRGYLSHGGQVTQFLPSGTSQLWATMNRPQGHVRLEEGSHLVCDRLERAIIKLDAKGKVVSRLSTRYADGSLRRPKDLVVDGSGGVYFTDPGFPQIRNPIGKLHYIDAAGKTHLLAGQLGFPQGIALTPDQKSLLVIETWTGQVLQYPIVKPGELGEPKVLIKLNEAGLEDLIVDQWGRIYLTSATRRAVLAYNASGMLLHTYSVDAIQPVALAFGDASGRTIYISGPQANNREASVVYLWELDAPREDRLP